ncbi:polyprenyl synthetase family protein [Sporosarcina aquimarina]|uniref:Polyprenyl synthetase family protein n=1 Tax=Sporosarcina aquimarina TaxID=114975 RepID=A0ABU4FW17_9BACL|nr:farnesyl diphosphate synthase [Sporosarcina aquimarina]MDW0108912.1 polyprenyl synthetase family protein [Sporosarcina aquimarina]
MNEQLKAFMDEKLPLLHTHFKKVFEGTNYPASLAESMAYSVNAGGKRIRPLLVLATLEDLKAASEDAIQVASAIEFIHTYSLIHDDLPCMDDDDVRRGNPTNHVVYGEATAVLAADALQTLAFEELASLQHTEPKTILAILKAVSVASGAAGMVGGQVLDMQGERTQLTLAELEKVHVHKTGALLACCIEAGALLANTTEHKKEKLRIFSENIGLAFQIKDDILDITATTEQLGKTANKDLASDKSTYPALLGLDGAQKKLASHHGKAMEALKEIELEKSLLAHIADYIIDRKA